METLEIIILSFGGTASALVAVGFLCKSLVSHWFLKELEQYKSKINFENNQALETLKIDLQKSLKKEDRSVELQALMNNYKGPLTHAAYELQSRIYNLIKLNIIETYFSSDDNYSVEKNYFVKNTMFVIAQYFAWTEIIRKEIQFIEFDNASISKELSDLQNAIYSLWQSSNYSDTFVIWAGDQRGIGELMIEERGDKLTCIGYAHFLEMLDEKDEFLFTQLESKVRDFLNPESSNSIRLIHLQNSLINLLDFLDPEYIRFPQECRTKIT